MSNLSTDLGKTGNAVVIKQGQTADDADGAYPEAPVVGRSQSVRDLSN